MPLDLVAVPVPLVVLVVTPRGIVVLILPVVAVADHWVAIVRTVAVVPVVVAVRGHELVVTVAPVEQPVAPTVAPVVAPVEQLETI